MTINLSVNFAGIEMKNPVTVASGTFGSGREYDLFYDISTLGAITTKGVSLDAWEGNEGPRISETPCGMLNSIGLQNKGVKTFIKDDLEWLSSKNVPIIVNVSGHSIQEYVDVILALDNTCVDAFEINVSCPNVDAGGAAIGTDLKKLEKTIKLCRNASKRPMIVKLSPNVSKISEFALCAQDSGADAVSMINTILAMSIDAKSRRPELKRVLGGLSGPAVKPIALKMVWETYNTVKIPILGMGGISSGEDAIEFILAGASAVSVGTANFTNPYAAKNVVNEIELFLKNEKVDDINELIGGLIC